MRKHPVLDVVIILLAAAGAAFGQVTVENTPGALPPTFPKGLRLGSLTVATLPASPALGMLAMITDGNSGTDCTIGNGASKLTCFYNGSAWVAFVASGGAGADALGYYLVSRAANAPANAVNLGALSTGLLGITVGGGVATLSTAPGPTCAKYTVAYTNAAFTAASTTAPVTLVALPARGKVTGVTIKHTTPFAGTAVASTTVSVGDGNATYDQYASAFDVFQAAGNTVFQDSAEFKSTTMASSNIVAYFTANVNFGDGAATVLSAGSVDIDVCLVTLP